VQTHVVGTALLQVCCRFVTTCAFLRKYQDDCPGIAGLQVGFLLEGLYCSYILATSVEKVSLISSTKKTF
jgi:hypothetical protein